MNIAWASADDAGPTVRRLAAAWAEPIPAGVDRDEGVRRLYEQHHADMVRFAAFLTGDISSAEDITHEAFVKVFHAWDRIDDHARADAYLRSTVVNLVRGGHRRRQVAERSPRPHLVAVGSAEDDALSRVGRDRVLAALAALPMRQRECVVMRHWMRMTESEIAVELDLTVGSVRTHLKRGTETLKTTLGDAR
jgi:RNA polymerase sigma-70 factor (sigma-E family)